ncbi:MAG: hypothetical protein HC877_16260 [Thioploca sp.]|nr:hypothetical protein [Thioploca sp.]
MMNYTLQDNQGKTLAKFCKNYWYNVIRKRWYCYAPSGYLLAIAKKGSMILLLLRRLLRNFFGILGIACEQAFGHSRMIAVYFIAGLSGAILFKRSYTTGYLSWGIWCHFGLNGVIELD